MKPILAVIALVLLAVPAAAAPRLKAVARVTGLDGKPRGSIIFDGLPRGVLITFDLTGLAPGPHAIALHVSGNCDAKKGFYTAGPILSLAQGHRHGYLAKDGPFAGDLPNQFAGADGRLHASVLTGAFTLGNGSKSIFDRDGASIIVAARADDYMSQPAGASGDRIACGVIVRTAGPTRGARKTKK